jgi:magnesium-transporting ATPase (P-type)
MASDYLHKSGHTRSWVNLVSGIIGIFTFVTGIQSMPSLIFKSNSKPIQSFSDIQPNVFFWPTVVFSQLLYYVFLYLVLTSVRKLFFHEKEFHPLSSRVKFWYLISLGFALAISLCFAEGFWGPLQHWSERYKDPIPIPILFCLFSIILICATVSVAMECSLLDF